MTELRLALDRASVRKSDDDGHLHVSLTPISKANVCPYYGREIPGWQELGLSADRIYRLYRDPSELEKAADSFNGKPLYFGHRPASAADHDHERTVGAVTGAVWQAPYLMARLDVWPSKAIDAIESGEHEQLSSGYAYRPDMTSGRTPDGEAYDGVMRDIRGNHVAMVPEGRAGPDVVVLDAKPPSLEDLFMTAKAHSRTADVARGALMIYLRPKLAQDAKIDLDPSLKGITAKNFRDKAPGLATAIGKLVKGKLAQDADIEDVKEVIEALADVLPADVESDDPLKTAALDGDADLRAMLKAKGLSDEEIDRICAMTPGATDADKYPPKDDKKDADMKTAQDAVIAAAVRAATAGTVSKSDLAAALKVAQDEAIKTQRDIREAERVVRPWVGDLAMGFDSAPEVFRAALKVLGVEGVDKLHPDALRPILESKPQPGAKPARPSLGLDAASIKGFVERYPAAARIGHA